MMSIFTKWGVWCLLLSVVGSGETLLGQYRPAVAGDSRTNSFFVTFSRYTEGRHDIIGEFLNADGVRLRDEIQISTFESDQDHAAVAYDSINGRFLVVWDDNRNNAISGRDIYGQLVNADGSLRGANFVISDAASDQYKPSVAFDDSTGRFFVVWEDDRNGGPSARDVYGQFVNADGSLQGTGASENLAVCIGGGEQSSPCVSYGIYTNRFLVTWDDRRNTSVTGCDVYGRVIGSDAVPAGGDFPIVATPGDQYASCSAFGRSESRFIVVWTDAEGENQRIRGRVLKADGTAEQGAIDIAGPAGSPACPAVGYDEVYRRFLVVWEDHENESVQKGNICGHWVHLNGVVLDAGFFPIALSANDEACPSVGFIPNPSRFLAGYQKDDSGTWSLGTATICSLSPEIELLNPGRGATDVPLDAEISVLFQDQMDPNTVDASTVTVSGVDGSVSCAGRWVGFTPNSLLSPGTTYTVTIKKDVRSLGGVNLVTDNQWMFTTVNAGLTPTPSAAPGAGDAGDGVGDEGSSVAPQSLCFVATAAYGDAEAHEVVVLRGFRDRRMLTNGLGRTCVRAYYRVSPSLAAVIARHDALRSAARFALTPVVCTIEYPYQMIAFVVLVWAFFEAKRRSMSKKLW